MALQLDLALGKSIVEEVSLEQSVLRSVLM